MADTRIKDVKAKKFNFKFNKKVNNSPDGSVINTGNNGIMDSVDNIITNAKIDNEYDDVEIQKSKSDYVSQDEATEKLKDQLALYMKANPDYDNIDAGTIKVDKDGHYYQQVTLKDKDGNSKFYTYRINDDKEAQTVISYDDKVDGSYVHTDYDNNISIKQVKDGDHAKIVTSYLKTGHTEEEKIPNLKYVSEVEGDKIFDKTIDDLKKTYPDSKFDIEETKRDSAGQLYKELGITSKNGDTTYYTYRIEPNNRIKLVISNMEFRHNDNGDYSHTNYDSRIKEVRTTDDNYITTTETNIDTGKVIKQSKEEVISNIDFGMSDSANKNSNEIYTYLKKKLKLDDVHIAAMMGNIRAEAGESMDPGVNTERLRSSDSGYRDNDYYDQHGNLVYTADQLYAMSSREEAIKAVKGLVPKKGGIGLFQFTGGKYNSATGRWEGGEKADYINWCNDNNLKWDDMDTQLKYWSERYSSWSGKSQFESIKDAGEAARYFCNNYEQPGNNTAGIRAQYANNYISKIRNSQQPAQSASSASASGPITTANEGTQAISHANKYVGNRYVWGGNSLTNGCDCSHFVHLILNEMGIKHGGYGSTGEMIGKYTSSGNFENIGTDLSKAKAGDIIVYNGHTGFIDSKGNLVEAQSKKAGITNYRSAADEASRKGITGILRYTGGAQ